MRPVPSSLPNQQAASAPPKPTWARGSLGAAAPARLGWLPLAAVGVAGVILGMMIGAVGFGLLSIVWHHGPGAHGDDRGKFWQDDRGGRPERGPFGR